MTVDKCINNTIVGHRFEPPSSLSFDWAEFLKSTSDLTRGVTFYTDTQTSTGFARTNHDHIGSCSVNDEYILQPKNTQNKFYLNNGEHCLDDCALNKDCTGVSYNYDYNMCHLLKKCHYVDDKPAHSMHFIKKNNH